jgi:hypothetical protein
LAAGGERLREGEEEDERERERERERDEPEPEDAEREEEPEEDREPERPRRGFAIVRLHAVAVAAASERGSFWVWARVLLGEEGERGGYGRDVWSQISLGPTCSLMHHMSVDIFPVLLIKIYKI